MMVRSHSKVVAAECHTAASNAFVPVLAVATSALVDGAAPCDPVTAARPAHYNYLSHCSADFHDVAVAVVAYETGVAGVGLAA